jgi:4-hydroxybenzoyl-CoA reductase subunit beta
MASILQHFTYERPKTFENAIKLLDGFERSSRSFVICAGGTDLVPYLKRYRLEPTVLVSLSEISELKKIEVNDSKRLRIGATVTLAELSRDKLVNKLAPGLAATASLVASPQIRNRATLGGNLLADNRCFYFNQSKEYRDTFCACFKEGGNKCHLIPNAVPGKTPLCRARFISDLAPVLMALNASVILVGPNTQRVIALRDFYLQDGIKRNQLESSEILTEIELDLAFMPQVTYQKLRIRNAIDFPSVGVAVGMCSRKGREDWTFSVTGINPAPIFVMASFLQEGLVHQARQDLVEKACQDVVRIAVSLKQDFFPPAYRKKMIPILIRRCVSQLLDGNE